MGSSSSSLSYNDLPDYLKNLSESTANYYNDIMGNANQTSQLISGLSGMASGASSAGSKYLSDVLSGNYLNFATNPGLQSAQSALSQQFSEDLGTSLNDVNRQAQSAGQFMSGANTAANVATTDKLYTDYLNQLGSLYNSAYTTGIGQQEDALSQLQNAYTNALSAQGLGSSGTSSLISSALGGGTMTSGFGLK